MARRPRADRALPSAEEIRAFVAAASGRVGKREIAREFGIDPELKPELRDLLKELSQEGAIAPAGHRRFAAPGRLPEAVVVRVTGTDPDGDAIARPVDWAGEGPPPLIYMRPERRDQPALAPGERVLARLKPIGGGKYEGRTLRRLTDEPGRILGVFQPAKGGGGRVQPTDRRAKAEWRIPPGEEGGAEADEIVVASPLPHGGLGLKPARVVERLGRMGDARSISLICIHGYEIPQESPSRRCPRPRALGQSRWARARTCGTCRWSRSTARMRATSTTRCTPSRTGTGSGCWSRSPMWRRYVRPGSALDRDARLRGNIVYFPDRVVPMLPEALSNGWCSLRPGEERGVPVRGNVHRAGRARKRAPLRPRPDAQRRAAHLHAVQEAA